jgi:cardiolipin synthase A/B
MRSWGQFTVVLLLLLSSCLKGTGGSRAFRIDSVVPDGREAFDAALYQTTGSRLVPGHSLELVNDGRVFDVIAEEIAQARQSVNVVTYIWRPGEASNRVLGALLERAKAGVACRVLVDPIGSKKFKAEVAPRLEDAGCKAQFFRPLPADENLARNHRKIVIVDGRVGITGGFGIHDSWLGDADSKEEWRDTNARVRGPAVGEMQRAFAQNWQEATGELLPREDFPTLSDSAACGNSPGAAATFITSTANPEVTEAERLTQLLVQSAKRRLWISQSYFTPNGPLKELLIARARAGADVRVLAPGDENDHPEITVAQRALYDELLPAGVQIWEYGPSMMHSKTMLVDDELALVGSINFDRFSFSFLEEGALLVRDQNFAGDLEATFLADLQRSKRVDAPAKASTSRR